ncbi:MAG: hypothetical protein ACREBS_00580 [Nitrososphaerales archaeon]
MLKSVKGKWLVTYDDLLRSGNSMPNSILNLSLFQNISSKIRKGASEPKITYLIIRNY